MHHARQRRHSNHNTLQQIRLVIGTTVVVVFLTRLFDASCHSSFGAWNVRGKAQLQRLPFDNDGVAQRARNLVIVAGHSVTISGHLLDADHDEEDWYLLDYQRGHGLPEAVVAHIVSGIHETAKDPEALLVFSGGATRPTTGPDTEGASYFRVADAMGLWDSTVRARTTSEDFAKDSFENLYVRMHVTVVRVLTFKLHSICRIQPSQTIFNLPLSRSDWSIP